ncbi:MAG TPA: right-handed parallel beta-helix repeat-containing protein, partial [Gemmatimonadaceae bacterium]|nr:right-handed parallel beta-helix repeat-containing protein [Gemmatimonadaceae bacterium]
QIIDKNGAINVTGSGYGGEGIYLDNQTGGVEVADNVVYRVSAHSMWISAGPAPGIAGNTIQNNIFAYGREASFVLGNPWPAPTGCAVTPALRVTVKNNVFLFDRNETSKPVAFFPFQGCAYSCGLPFDQFEAFSANLYWGTGAAASFSDDDHQFHVDQQTTTATATSCPITPSSWTFMSFAQWQTDPTLGGVTVAMDEDQGGVIADPGFAGASYPQDDYALAQAPVMGFDPSQTNATLQTAGRTSTMVTVAQVPPTYPTYVFDPSTDF